MMSINKCVRTLLFFFLALDIVHLLAISETDTPPRDVVNADPVLIEVSWSTHDYNLHTIPTLQLVTNPLVARQFSPISKEVFSNLKQLNAEYARYAVWFPYPKLAVAELDPPSGVFQCGNVGEQYSINLSCEQSDGVINTVDFASFGTSSGACGQMRQGQCHAANSTSIVQQACIGKQKCSVSALDQLFGDPCKFCPRIAVSCNYFSLEIRMKFFSRQDSLF